MADIIMLDESTMRRIDQVVPRIMDKFNESDWKVLGARTASLDVVVNHHRLLKSMSWGDGDYEGHVIDVLYHIAGRAFHNIDIIESVVRARYPDAGENISTAKSTSRPIIFTPSVFEVPEGGVEHDFVAIMMPFDKGFQPVYNAIDGACSAAGLRFARADNVWEHSAIIQDIFSLIFRANIVICDFSGKNANVFYEAGIAHTLGKNVIPIAQHMSDIPFDIAQHRVLLYQNNGEGHVAMRKALTDRLRTLMGNTPSQLFKPL